MGCNTSKETVAPNEAEADAETKQVDVEEVEKKSESVDRKSESAKTITLSSNGTAKTPGLKSDNRSKSEDKAGAATKIQAAFRGHKIRKSMKQPSGNNTNETEPTQQQLQDEFRSDDQELSHAATKIQASFRGHMSRKQMEKKDDDGSSQAKIQCASLVASNLLRQFYKLCRSCFWLYLQILPHKSPSRIAIKLCHAVTKIQASFRGHMTRKQMEKKDDETTASSQAKDEEELDIDLTDPDLNKAAIKIQASFRGHMVRKDNEGEAEAQ